MAIRQNRYYNNPEIGAAFSSLAQIFAPPSAQDAAAYAVANAKRAEAQRAADLYAYASNPSFDQTQFDRRGIAAGVWNPSQGYHALDLNAATTRRGQDVSAAASRYGSDRTFEASRLNNTADNARALEQTRLGNTKDITVSMLAPVADGATRFVPPSIASMYGTPETQVGTLSAAQGETIVAPNGQTLNGAPKPLGVDEVKAAELQKARAAGVVGDRELMASVLGDPKLEQVQGPDGPIYARAIDAVGQRPATDVAKAGEQAHKLRGEIAQLPSYKNYAYAAPIYRAMVGAAGTNTKAADLDLVYGFGKIMDPTSVVREGEMVLVQNTASLPDWVIGAVSRLNGGAVLQPETRAALLAEAHNRMKSYEDVFAADVDRYSGIVDRAGIRRDDVLPPFERSNAYRRPTANGFVPAGATAPAGTPALGQPATPSSGENLPVPQTQADFDALPPGARYRDPDDGRTYRKP